MSAQRKVAKVVIVGRANVGKSSIFNALCGERKSIVDDYAGVTRDSIQALIAGEDLAYELVDTGGLFAEQEEELFQHGVEKSVTNAVARADLVVCIFDGVVGPHPLDQEIVNRVRRSGKPALWVVNKCEKPETELAATEFHSFGLDEIHTTSAAHRQGTALLRVAIEKKLTELGFRGTLEAQNKQVAIQVAIVGKPNVGKSTLVNRLYGEERVIVSDTPGTTRDSIDVTLQRNGRTLVLIDTAGLRRKQKIEKSSIERFSTLRSLRALARADVALLVLDTSAEDVVTEQDKNIARLIHDRGIPVIIVANKWDAVEKDHKTSKKVEEAIYNELQFMRYAPVCFVSALSGKRCPVLYEKITALYDALEHRIPTPELNRTLEKLFNSNPPPPSRGREIRLYFATQIRNRPPTFIFFCNYPKSISASYERYLKNGMRETWPFEGVELKIVFRKRKDNSTEEEHEGARS